MGDVFFDVFTRINPPNFSEIELIVDRCVNTRWAKKNLCVVCKENCVADAINIKNGVEIDWRKCIKCGVCAAVCPTEVFKIQAPSDNMILNSIIKTSGNKPVVIKCNFVDGRFKGKEKQKTSKGRKIVVPCIGRFSEILLIQIILKDTSNVEFVKCTSDCVFSEGRNVIEEMWRRVERLLKLFGTSIL